ncbi:MAG TPA: GTP 3',8-cyclase MoaA [Actinomycetes bacterium]|jgi:cyclic pyranopterin phosphate synthase|nr:GTP 3',8-cyclase MoaA [Actinomycetes bacterium]
MVDAFGRVVRDLRVSVTDRCNFRCLYCMPEDGLPWIPRGELLTRDELVRALRVAVGLGVRTVRVTGGEPTLRRDLVDVVAAVAALGVELSITTNGFLMDRLAEPLRQAGLGRANISLDSLRRDRFQQITRRDALDRVLRGIDATLAAGLRPVKINAVVVRGFNDDELEPMAAWARDLGVELRFIEFMPLDAPGEWTRDQVVPAGEILTRLDRAFGLQAPDPRGSAPAERYRYADGRGAVGIIASVTRAFCAQCDRIRLTADGQVRTCLFATTEHDLRAALRSSPDDEAVAAVYLDAVARKQWGHRINEPDFVQPARGMSQIGG